VLSIVRRVLASPRLRAGFVAFHGAAVVLLSLPTGAVSDERWKSKGTQADLAEWGSGLGEGNDFALWFQRVAKGYADVRGVVVAPFNLYAESTGARQGWAMFSSPQRYPAEVHVDAKIDGQWVAIYRPHDEATAFDSAFLTHHRLRKFQGRFAREWKGKRFQEFAAFLAKRALAAHPNAEAVRVRLERKRSLPPEAVRMGTKAKGSYEVTHVFDRKRQP
jgi:hypothetical protein